MSSSPSSLDHARPAPATAFRDVREIGMTVRDLDTSVQLCTEVLGGAPSLESGRDSDGRRWRVCRFSNVDLRLTETGEERDRLTYVGLDVTSLAAAEDQLAGHGIQLADGAIGVDGAARFTLTDPATLNGVALKLIEGEQALAVDSRAAAGVPADARMQRLLHVGLNIVDLEAGRDRLAAALGARPSAVFRRPVYGLRFAMVRLGGIELELLSPDSSEGTLASSIAKVGEGIVHLCWSVRDLSATLAWMRESGRRLIDETPLEILHLRAAFVHPTAFNGVLYELVEGEHTFFEPGVPEAF